MTDETKEDAAVREAWTVLEFARCTVPFARAAAEMCAVEAAVEARTRARLAAAVPPMTTKTISPAAVDGVPVDLDRMWRFALNHVGYGMSGAILAVISELRASRAALAARDATWGKPQAESAEPDGTLHHGTPTGAPTPAVSRRDGRLRAAAEAACEALWTSLDDRGHCAQCDAGWAEYDAIRATLDDITDEARRV